MTMRQMSRMNDEQLEAPGRCDYEVDEETCVASATLLIVGLTTTVTIGGQPARVEFLTCAEHVDSMRTMVAEAGFDNDGEHAYEHRCAVVFTNDRGEALVHSCDCGRILGVE